MNILFHIPGYYNKDPFIPVFLAQGMSNYIHEIFGQVKIRDSIHYYFIIDRFIRNIKINLP